MKGAIETMVGIVLLAFITVMGTSYIVVALNNQSAQNYHSAVIVELEESNMSDAVIADCIAKAEENGYNSLVIDKKTGVSGNSYAKVTLNYDYSIPILNMFLQHEIVGYAR